MKRLWKLFYSLSRERQIAFSVFSAHFLLFFSLFLHHWITGSFAVKKPIVIRTVAAPPPTFSAASPSRTPSGSSLAASTAAPSKPKRPAVKPKKIAPTSAKPEATKKIAERKEPTAGDAQQAALLKELEKSLEALTSSSSEIAIQPRSALHVPAPVAFKASLETSSLADTFLSASYSERLVSFLQEGLDLPEYGEVKVRLEIDRFGNLIDCQILQEKNRKNSEFLKKRLSELSYPLSESLPASFTIVFRNLSVDR